MSSTISFDDGLRDCAVRHPLPARARATDGREDHRRRALLQPYLRRAPAHRVFRRAVRLLARLETRRPVRGRPEARLRHHRRRRGGDRWRRMAPQRADLRAARHGASDLRHPRHADRSRHARVAAGTYGWRGAEAFLWPAFVLLRGGARASGLGRDAARPFGPRIRRRDDHDAAQGRPRASRSLFGQSRFGRRARRAELQGDGRVSDGALGRRGRR